jgi:hypothetical protein
VFQNVSPPAGAETKFDTQQWTLGNITKTHFLLPLSHNPMLGFLVSYNKLYGRFSTKLSSSFINNEN